MKNEFKKIASLLKQYSPPFEIRESGEGILDLYLVKDLHLFNHDYKEMFFAGIKQKSKYIAFYFMPIYMNSKLIDSLSPLLINKLKGKSCFHLSKFDDDIYAAIKSALVLGYDFFKTLN